MFPLENSLFSLFNSKQYNFVNTLILEQKDFNSLSKYLKFKRSFVSPSTLYLIKLSSRLLLKVVNVYCLKFFTLHARDNDFIYSSISI